MSIRFLKLIPLVFLILIACNLLSTEPTEEIRTEELQNQTPIAIPTISGEAQEMNCKEMGLPCTPAEADPKTMERSAEIYQELKTRLEEGESIESLRGWLESMDEMRMVLSNSVSVMFILEGGLPFGVYDAVLAGGRGEPETSTRSGSKVLASYRPPSIPVAEVVGQGTPRENDRRHKRALILSPFDFEFNIRQTVCASP